MSLHELVPYYERELSLLRTYLREFAQSHRRAAVGLAIGADTGQSQDPHVERLVQTFALLAANRSRKLDDHYPEFTEALIETLYPHYLRPFPPCSIAYFDHQKLEQLTAPMTIARGTELKAPKFGGHGGIECQFTTVYEVVQAPLCIRDVVFHPVVDAPVQASVPRHATACLSITLETVGPYPSLGKIAPPSLRLYVDAEAVLATALMDTLFIDTAAVYVEPERSRKWTRLTQPVLHAAGFEDGDALLDRPTHSCRAYRLLSEYFAYPEKFNFFDLDLRALIRQAGPCRALTLHVVLQNLPADSPASRLLENTSTANLRLACSPMVNLFAKPGPPYKVGHATATYPAMTPAQVADYEVYSIDSVRLDSKDESGKLASSHEVRALNSLHHRIARAESGESTLYWVSRQNDLEPIPNPAIAFVDETLQPCRPDATNITMTLTCTNRDLPSRLPVGQLDGDLTTSAQTVGNIIRLLHQPTRTLRPERGGAMQWRMLSHLSPNQFSLFANGLPALKETLRIYSLGHSALPLRQIEALTKLECRASTQWIGGKPFASFVRGLEIRLSIDTEAFVGASLHAFVLVLDHFFALHVNQNSFTQTIAISAHGGRELIRREPRRGQGILL
ncbi:MAG: type VI secretion system baseplate subunit TssF [Burkholderiaceae bacterium]|jgi:type VI secretion system protein ImpG|nr:type VI secretion system baseplate subunit TssF [Burkholderiaceae bacterium]